MAKNQERRRIPFTARERQLMTERCDLSPELRSLLAGDARRSRTVVLNAAQLEQLRDAVADRLQRAGFDQDWNVNQEGVELESIIDKLQPPRS